MAVAFPGLNDLRRPVTPIFLLVKHFLYQIFYVQRKNEKNQSTTSLSFLQNAASNSVLFSSSFFCAAASNVS